ncbi:hypothetical protein N658DRAFT_487603 [Parathielavia hyrcaniae]|uniref:Bys1 family protein n=1 Tax=Parathielavia hyrcaniae TaxID=113614 RepID=A0AAN6SZW4_9PEZI|nr:hypothetical protein N658DRAFT_487603 [Parathielavia hyrcaniae]
MLAKISILTLAAAAPLASALGKARVVNNCDETVHLWSVGSQVAGPYALSPQGSGYYAEEFRKDPVTGGMALKVTRAADGLYTGAPQTVFAYNLDGDKIWYDLSDVFGDPFVGHKLVVASVEQACPSIIWPTGVPPAGSQVKVCTSDQDVIFTLCAD